ncbi:MAG: MotA/TolQ/ExbB proton channel family protein [Pseudomonadota bacterium]|nr:MotA/TolQ/ExbB proton channel family protein [Pseudomonadota bacterium]
MFKMIRLATAAAVLLAMTSGFAPHVAAQGQPSAPGAPSTAPAATPAAPATSGVAAPAPAAAAPSAAAAPASPAGSMAAKPATEIVDNPYGLEALWKGGDMIARITLAILALMSMGSWYVIITKLYEQAKLKRQARVANDQFWNAPSVAEATAALKEGSPFRFIAQSGVEASQKHTGLRGNVSMNDWISMSIQRAMENIQSRLQDGLALLATVGSTAPFVGLFGTVWGIYHALTAIGIAGQASIDKVAGPVGEALIMTAFGLAVAVPAVLGYNWLVRRNKSAMEQVRGFGADLHAVLMASPTPTPQPV